MEEITTSRIGMISDSGSGPQEQPPAQKPRVKAAAAGKPAPHDPPKIGAPEEGEKHELDEMA